MTEPISSFLSFFIFFLLSLDTLCNSLSRLSQSQTTRADLHRRVRRRQTPISTCKDAIETFSLPSSFSHQQSTDRAAFSQSNPARNLRRPATSDPGRFCCSRPFPRPPWVSQLFPAGKPNSCLSLIHEISNSNPKRPSSLFPLPSTSSPPCLRLPFLDLVTCCTTRGRRCGSKRREADLLLLSSSRGAAKLMFCNIDLQRHRFKTLSLLDKLRIRQANACILELVI